MAYQYGPCSKRKEKKPEMVKPTLKDLDLAVRDVAEMGWGCATEWSQYVITWFEKHS